MKSKHLVSIAQRCGSLLPVLYLVRAKILGLIPHNEFNFASELHCSFHSFVSSLAFSRYAATTAHFLFCDLML